MNLSPDLISASSGMLAAPNLFSPLVVDSGTLSATRTAVGTMTLWPQGSGYRLVRTIADLPNPDTLSIVLFGIKPRLVDSAVLFSKQSGLNPAVAGLGGILDAGTVQSDGTVSGSVQMDLRAADSAALTAGTVYSYFVQVTLANGTTQVVETGNVYLLGSA